MQFSSFQDATMPSLIVKRRDKNKVNLPHLPRRHDSPKPKKKKKKKALEGYETSRNIPAYTNKYVPSDEQVRYYIRPDPFLVFDSAPSGYAMNRALPASVSLGGFAHN